VLSSHLDFLAFSVIGNHETCTLRFTVHVRRNLLFIDEDLARLGRPAVDFYVRLFPLLRERSLMRADVQTHAPGSGLAVEFHPQISALLKSAGLSVILVEFLPNCSAQPRPLGRRKTWRSC
jgi:hypothetical protein